MYREESGAQRRNLQDKVGVKGRRWEGESNRVGTEERDKKRKERRRVATTTENLGRVRTYLWTRRTGGYRSLEVKREAMACKRLRQVLVTESTGGRIEP